MENIKENGVLIGVVAFVVFIIIFIIISSTTSGPTKKKVSEVVPETTTIKTNGSSTFIGTVLADDGKKGLLSYSFVLPENATSTVEEGGAYIKTTIENKPFIKIFFSDESERDQTPKDYLTKIIAPRVIGFTLADAVKIDGVEWQKAESTSMEWHVASVLSGKWLVMVESYKKDHDAVEKVLSSMNVNTK